MIRKIRNYQQVDESKTDRYLITYADLITLLLGLFVILYASAQVDEEKYKELSQAFSSYFQPGEVNSSNGNGILNGSKTLLPNPSKPVNSDRSIANIAQQTEQSLKKFIDDGTIRIKKGDKELTLVLSESLLFESAKAEVQPSGKEVLDSVSKFLTGIDYEIKVDGHTDSSPIKTFRYESNWHLSISRALNVAYLMVRNGVPEKNLVIRGYGAQRPESDNITEGGRTLNRRVEITITDLPDDALTTKGYSVKDSAVDNSNVIKN